MDAHSWTPFTPLLNQQPMNDDHFDFQPYALADDELAPIYRRPNSQVGQFFGVGHTQLCFSGHSSAGQRRQATWTGDFNPFDYEVETTDSVHRDSSSFTTFFPENVSQDRYTPLAVAASSGDAIRTTGSSSNIDMGTLTAVSSSILKPVSFDGPKPNRFTEENALENLSHSLKDRSMIKSATQVLRNDSKRSCSNSTIICEYPGCEVKFGRKKDRNRHFRKHQANEGFTCPLADCSMGPGHKIQRRDKLREHLRRKGDVSSWQCILPGCSTIVTNRTELTDHLGQHDRITRLAHQQLLIEYSFINGDLHPGLYYDKPPLGYLTCSFICEVPGCPFGTNSIGLINQHKSIPHEGAFCPCPMPNCQQIFQDWPSTSTHLARSHDANDRKAHDRELLSQGFWWRNSMFTCPICKVEIKILLNKASCDEKIREHCNTHDAHMLKIFEEELVRAFASSNRRTLWYPRMPLLEPASDEEVFAYLTWPKEKLLEIWNMGGSL